MHVMESRFVPLILIPVLSSFHSNPLEDNDYGAVQEVEEQGEENSSKEVVRIVDVEGYFKNYAGTVKSFWEITVLPF